MRISPEQILGQPLKQLKPLYTLFGAEPLLILEAADALRKAAREAGYSERELLSAEPGFDWNSLLMSGANLSLFATRRMLELRIPGGKPGVEGGRVIEEFCARLPDETITIVTLPEIDWQGQRSKWFAALEKAGVMVEARSVERAQLPQWLQGRFARQNQHLERDALEFLADQVEGNLLAAMQEIRKLALLLPHGEIRFEQVKDVVLDVSRYNPFQLADAIHEGDVKRMQRILDGLKAEGEAPPLILWVLANEVRQLLRAVGATRAGRALPPKKEQQVQRTARRHSARTLYAALLQAARIDRMIKGLDNGDVWLGLLQLGAAIAGKATLQQAA
jgi:DNA polymerase III subunit delta